MEGSSRETPLKEILAETSQRETPFRETLEQKAWREHLMLRFNGMMETVMDRMDQLELNLQRSTGGSRGRHNSPSYHSRNSHHSEEEEEEVEQPRRHRRGREEVDRSFKNVKLEIPKFLGKNDPEAYIDWEIKVEKIFTILNYS